MKRCTRKYIKTNIGNLIPEDYSLVDIDFKEKREGDQVGIKAIIRYQNEKDDSCRITEVKYHIKTHENGRSTNNAYSRLCNPRELFVYEFLKYIDLGPQVVRIYYERDYLKDVYIATKDIDIQDIGDKNSFRTFDFDCNDTDFVNSFTEDEVYIKALVYLELISKMLCINDINNNLSNFGFVRKIKKVDESSNKDSCLIESYKSVRIVDFFVCNQLIKQDNIKRFEKKDISLKNKKNTGLKKKEINLFYRVESKRKQKFASEILKDLTSKEEYFFYHSYLKALESTSKFVENYENEMDDNEKKTFAFIKANYENYTQKIKENIEKFMKHYCKDWH